MADKGYDTFDFVNELRSVNVRPHVARPLRGSAIDRRTKRHPGYGTSQRIRKRIEEAFGWVKTIGGMRRPMRRGTLLGSIGWIAAHSKSVRSKRAKSPPASRRNQASHDKQALMGL